MIVGEVTLALGQIEVSANGDAGLGFSEMVAADFVELPHPALHDFIEL